MESQMLSFQFTAFIDIDIETAKLFVKSFDGNYRKTGLPPANIKGAPIYRVDSNLDGSFINISLERIDCFYPSYDIEFVGAFLDQLKKFNSWNSLKINRLAINYVELYLDADYKLTKKLNNHFKFAEVFGESQELMFRLNNEQMFKQFKLNIITTLQSGMMTNNMTFEDTNGIIVHYDINNKPEELIDFADIDNCIKELYKILINQQGKIVELLTNE